MKLSANRFNEQLFILIIANFKCNNYTTLRKLADEGLNQSINYTGREKERDMEKERKRD